MQFHYVPAVCSRSKCSFSYTASPTGILMWGITLFINFQFRPFDLWMENPLYKYHWDDQLSMGGSRDAGHTLSTRCGAAAALFVQPTEHPVYPQQPNLPDYKRSRSRIQCYTSSTTSFDPRIKYIFLNFVQLRLFLLL